MLREGQQRLGGQVRAEEEAAVLPELLLLRAWAEEGIPAHGQLRSELVLLLLLRLLQVPLGLHPEAQPAVEAAVRLCPRAAARQQRLVLGPQGLPR